MFPRLTPTKRLFCYYGTMVCQRVNMTWHENQTAVYRLTYNLCFQLTQDKVDFMVQFDYSIFNTLDSVIGSSSMFHEVHQHDQHGKKTFDLWVQLSGLRSATATANFTYLQPFGSDMWLCDQLLPKRKHHYQIRQRPSTAEPSCELNITIRFRSFSAKHKHNKNEATSK